MVGFLVNCARIGFPRSRSEVIRIVQQVCDRRGVTCVVSHGWWKRFCQRHPSICLRTPTTLSHARVKGASPEAIGAYFDTLEETLSRNDLLDKPGQVFNMDETAIRANNRHHVHSDMCSITIGSSSDEEDEEKSEWTRIDGVLLI